MIAGQIKAKYTFECICTELSAEGIKSQNRNIPWGTWYLCSSQLPPHELLAENTGLSRSRVTEPFLAPGLGKGLPHLLCPSLNLALFWCLSLRREPCSSEVGLPCVPTMVCGCPLCLLFPTLHVCVHVGMCWSRNCPTTALKYVFFTFCHQRCHGSSQRKVQDLSCFKKNV